LPETHRQVCLVVRNYREMFDNSQRHHSTLGYQSPNAFEGQATGSEVGVLSFGPRDDRSMTPKYSRSISRDSSNLVWATAQHIYSHNSLFSLSILIGSRQAQFS
jgi:hypothetical protein